jgi:hypothetical protein
MIEVIKRLGVTGGRQRRPPHVPALIGSGEVDEETVAAIAMALALEARQAPSDRGSRMSLWVLSGRIQQLNRAPRV